MLIVAAAVLVVMSSLGRDISSCLLKLEIPRLRWDDKKFVPEDQKKCEAIASSRFDDYLVRREGTGGLHFSCDSRTRVTCILRGGLQRPDPRADQKDAARRPLFCFTFRKDPPSIFSTF